MVERYEMQETSPRMQLPLLVPGQGQKDITHNEALLRLDMLLHPCAISRTAIEPAQPAIGECWLVADDPGGAWYGQQDAVALWTQGGWRFAQLPEGGRVWIQGERGYLRRERTGWVREIPTGTAMADLAVPAGGDVVDMEARAVIAALIARLGLDQKGTSSSRSSAAEAAGCDP